MRVAMITYHRALNYGAVLQAYALQQTIKSLGNSDRDVCKLLDYKCPAIEDMGVLVHWDKRIIKDLIKYIPYSKVMESKKKRFAAFVSNHLDVQKLDNNDLKSINDYFDVFITGSDQLWNYSVCGDDDTYFLNFVEDERKKYSYAVSLGMLKSFEQYEQRIKKNLHGFSCISLRENICGEKLSTLGCAIRADIDPTLLWDTEKWEEEFLLENTEGEYILIYCVAPPRELIEIARKLATQTGLKVVFLTDLIAAKYKYHDFTIKYGQGPEDFLALIKNAQYVLTTSFHGAVFSIKFHKKFYAEIENLNGHNDRISGLLEKLDLAECTDKNFLLAKKEVTPEKWEQVDQAINSLKSDSLNYLRTVLSSEDDNV
ncbi:Polysaccharide pyruvyl transferase [Sporomusa ovata DSM 2662]|uniref:Gll3707 protein n=1 Tax=Sporomusa ovata TaxID=2378 RepID=A0A0U1KSX3_9FIRM|nr:polysaccharide pyruvyl transferase family protein [Sporomusa ovata]EQB26444.1 putative polysaccharide pyruvyl transferase [Sporomusa ovata DSM 2662]CQR70528.1 Gll3707 protein [Sporomusa ovata]